MELASNKIWEFLLEFGALFQFCFQNLDGDMSQSITDNLWEKQSVIMW